MTIAKKIEQATTEEEIVFPPSDLYSDVFLLAVPPLESDIHLQQIIILLESLHWLWQDRNDFYAAGNLTIYYSLGARSLAEETSAPSSHRSSFQDKSSEFRGPDFFVVLDTERKSRKSWVVWEENGQYPHVIVEILFPNTASVDKNRKKEIYQNIFRTPEYYWFDPIKKELTGFNLVNGKYQPIPVDERGYLHSEQLVLYLGVDGGFLRFFTLEGQIVPKPLEVAFQAQKRAQEAERKAERLAAKLRELNIDPETFLVNE